MAMPEQMIQPLAEFSTDSAARAAVYGRCFFLKSLSIWRSGESQWLESDVLHLGSSGLFGESKGTVRMNHTREVFTPQISRKRKEREESFKGNNSNRQPTSASNTTSSKPAEPISSNQLLAGYMALEFLRAGTLLGQKFDPARAEGVPVSLAEPKKKPGQNNSNIIGNSSEADGTAGEPSVEDSSAAKQCYAELANLLKTDGTHIPGIVNPTQLEGDCSGCTWLVLIGGTSCLAHFESWKRLTNADGRRRSLCLCGYLKNHFSVSKNLEFVLMFCL
ncbi:hypothetical protein Nepgr_031024 [Nepenthes gracilis]|uniref:Uncharacterized protein n=1 Tax=Nepenthes gracilis TaxID=150966 RepID=A0AAD3THP6_NEPGR|nr:hypothetical protein Nepgr_031024 [Nepenthes gracilis]